MKTIRSLVLAFAFVSSLFGMSPSFGQEISYHQSTSVRILLDDWAKKEAGEYLSYRDSLLRQISALGFKNFHSQCRAETLLETPEATRILLTVEISCTGPALDHETFEEFISSLKDELGLEIRRELSPGAPPAQGRTGGAGVSN